MADALPFLIELGRLGYGGVRAAISVQAFMATQYLAEFGSKYLHEEFLRPALHGKHLVALAITEPEAGSSFAHTQTSARPVPGGFEVNGSKSLVTLGSVADSIVTVVRTRPPNPPGSPVGLTLLLIPADTVGVEVVPTPTVGWRACGTATVIFNRVVVPATHVIGTPDSAFYYLMRCLDTERLVAAAIALGELERFAEDAAGTLIVRRSQADPISGKQVLMHELADLVIGATATRHLIEAAAAGTSAPRGLSSHSAMAKLMATELAQRAAAFSLRVRGGAGLYATSGLDAAYHDAVAATIAAGPSEVMRDLVAQDFLASVRARGAQVDAGVH